MNINVQMNAVFKNVDASKKRYILMKGSAGSGKSVDTAQHYILRLMKDRGRNLLCVRKSDVTNRQSTFAELQSAIFTMFGDKWNQYWYINTSNMLLECKHNHNQIIFRGMNDDKQREKLKSITFKQGKLTDIWLEEATEMTEQDIDILDDRLRGKLPEGLFYQMRFTFNPVSAQHWIKKKYFDRADDDVYCHHSTYETNRFIDEAYRRRMERRKIDDPDGYRVYGLGEWGEVSGCIFTNYTVEDVPQDLEFFDDVAIGQDFGFNHANAIYIYGMKDDEIYVIRGLYGFEKDTTEWIALADKAQIPKNRVMWCDSAEPDRIKMWVKAGYRAKPVSKEPGSVKAQIDWLKGKKIHIDANCVDFIKEIGQWKWKHDDRTNTYLDEPVPFFDDAMASMRYGVEGWRKKKTWIV